MSPDPRERWDTRTGFVLAAIGSAVGLGNMWRFSYLVAENGGAAFVLVYLAMTLGIALPVMLAEFAIGRGSRQSPILAFARFGRPAWAPLGFFFVMVGFVILAYYSVIAGWTARYAIEGLWSGFGADSAARFGQISQGPGALAWHAIFMLATVSIVAGGIQRGIERSAILLMPSLFVLIVGLAIYAATLDGASDGYHFYLAADFSKVASREVLLAAAGQAFFSLSVGMGVMATYASYVSEREHLPGQSLTIAGADFGVAFAAGLAIFPLLFAFGLSSQVSESTVGVLFVVLPGAFAEMGTAGRVIGCLFFAALMVAALTSTISMLEVVTATLMDRFGWERKRAAILMGIAIGICGIPPALDTDILGLMDGLAAQVCLPAGALALSLFVGWVMPDAIGEVQRGAERARWLTAWLWLLRIPVPLVLLVVVVESLRSLLS